MYSDCDVCFQIVFALQRETSIRTKVKCELNEQYLAQLELLTTLSLLQMDQKHTNCKRCPSCHLPAEYGINCVTQHNVICGKNMCCCKWCEVSCKHILPISDDWKVTQSDTIIISFNSLTLIVVIIECISCIENVWNWKKKQSHKCQAMQLTFDSVTFWGHGHRQYSVEFKQW